MSIDMYLGSSDQQASSAQHVLQNHINAYQQLQTALSQFTVNSPSLSGVTYQSAKAYSSQVLTPLLRASILLDEAIIAACRKLPSEYRSSVDSVDLRESDLVDRIARADRIVGRYQELINIEYQRKKPNWSRIQNLQTARSNQLTVKRKLEEKLHKLRAFHQSSPQIFSQIAGLHSAVQQGIRQSQQSWNASTKTFVLPPKSEMKWAEEVNRKWKKSPTYMQEMIHKSQKGFELSDKECEALGQYLLDNPNSKLYKNGIRALQKKIDGKLEKNNFLAGIIDALFGSVYSTDIEGSVDRNTSFWSSKYVKYSSKIEVDEDGIFKGKFHNGTVNGFAIDLKILSLDVDVTDWHLNASIGAMSNAFGLNSDFGLNTSTQAMEFNISGYRSDGKSSDDLGVKITTDFINGIGGIYHKHSSIKPISKLTTQINTVEVGGQSINGGHLVIAGAAYVALPIVAPIVIGWLSMGAPLPK